MKGAASLAYPRTPRPDLTPLSADETATCGVCGGPADARPPGNAPLWDVSFTDFASVAHRHHTICYPCRHAAKTATLNSSGGPISLTRTPPKGTAGFVLEQQTVTPLPGGLPGLELLVELSTRESPFGVLVGRWSPMEKRHYWLQIPTTYGAPTYPVLHVRSGEERTYKGPLPTVWLHVPHIERVISAAQDAIETAGSFAKVKKSAMKTDQYPELKALLAPWDDGWEYGSAAIAAVNAIRDVFFTG